MPQAAAIRQFGPGRARFRAVWLRRVRHHRSAARSGVPGRSRRRGTPDRANVSHIDVEGSKNVLARRCGPPLRTRGRRQRTPSPGRWPRRVAARASIIRRGAATGATRASAWERSLRGLRPDRPVLDARRPARRSGPLLARPLGHAAPRGRTSRARCAENYRCLSIRMFVWYICRLPRSLDPRRRRSGRAARARAPRRAGGAARPEHQPGSEASVACAGTGARTRCVVNCLCLSLRLFVWDICRLPRSLDPRRRRSGRAARARGPRRAGGPRRSRR